MGQAGQPEQAHKKPGRTLVVVIVVALVVVGAAVVLVVAHRRAEDWRAPYRNVRLLGEALKGKLPKDARALIFRAPGVLEMMPSGIMKPPGGPGTDFRKLLETDFRKITQEEEAPMKAAFEKGAGVTIVLVANVAPQVGEGGYRAMGAGGSVPADGYNAVLKNYEGKLDAVVLTAGVPVSEQFQWELGKLSCYNWSKKPLVVADVGVFYDPALLKQWISTRLLEGVVLLAAPTEPEEPAKIKLITKANLGEMPARAPMQMPTMMPGLRAAPPAGPPAGAGPAEGAEKKEERKEVPAAE